MEKCDAVYLVAGVIPVLDELHKRVLKFVLSCYYSDSDLVRFVAKLGIDACVNSPLGRNVYFVLCVVVFHCFCQ